MNLPLSIACELKDIRMKLYMDIPLKINLLQVPIIYIIFFDITRNVLENIPYRKKIPYFL